MIALLFVLLAGRGPETPLRDPIIFAQLVSSESWELRVAKNGTVQQRVLGASGWRTVTRRTRLSAAEIEDLVRICEALPENDDGEPVYLGSAAVGTTFAHIKLAQQYGPRDVYIYRPNEQPMFSESALDAWHVLLSVRPLQDTPTGE